MIGFEIGHRKFETPCNGKFLYIIFHVLESMDYYPRICSFLMESA
jgi:hypothetical protein